MKLDLENGLVVLGTALLAVGLWMTVEWWALVVLGALTVVFGVLIGMGRNHA